MNEPEKPLFQIAVERILHRLVHLKIEDREAVLLAIMRGAVHAAGDPKKAASDAARAVLPILFPELRF